MVAMSGTPRFRRRPDVLTRTAPEFVALARPDGHNVTLAGPAAALWLLLEEPGTAHDLARSLAARYDADTERIVADIAPVLERLQVDEYVATDD